MNLYSELIRWTYTVNLYGELKRWTYTVNLYGELLVISKFQSNHRKKKRKEKRMFYKKRLFNIVLPQQPVYFFSELTLRWASLPTLSGSNNFSISCPGVKKLCKRWLLRRSGLLTKRLNIDNRIINISAFKTNQ